MGRSNTPTAKSSLYKTTRWRKKRKALLDREPLCRFCAERGVTTAASVADHVVPHRGDEELFWNGELQGLCATCHNSDKQRIEKGGKPRQAFGDDGWPI